MKLAVAVAILGVAAMVAATPVAAVQYKTYQSTKDGYSLAVPSQWEVRQEKDSSTTFTGSTGVLVVSVRPRAGCTWETLPAYSAPFVLTDKVKVLNQGKRTVSGMAGWLYQYQTKDSADNLRGDTLCLLNEESLYIVAYVTRDWLYDASRVVFEKAIRTLKLFTPEGGSPLTEGYRRFDDVAHGFRLQVPAAWQATSGDAATPAFAGEDGTLQILVDSGAKYLAGDAEILAKAYVNRAKYKLTFLAAGKLDGQPAHFAYCEPPDKPEWGGCFILFVRNDKLHVLKITYHQSRRKDVVQQIAGSFQFLASGVAPNAPRKPASKLSRSASEK